MCVAPSPPRCPCTVQAEDRLLKQAQLALDRRRRDMAAADKELERRQADLAEVKKEYRRSPGRRSSQFHGASVGPGGQSSTAFNCGGDACRQS